MVQRQRERARREPSLRTARMELSGWGRYPRVSSTVVRPERLSEVVPPQRGQVIARGQGRSYGNAAISAEGLVMLTERLDRFLDFDEESGLLRAEAGATIAEVLETFVPRGWFPSVTPGTKFVSLGGCVAFDVHGKNHHHDGTFSNHVAEIELVQADGKRVRCGPKREAELFWATVGGMGLTGIITEVTFQLIPIESAHIVVQHHPARNLDESLSSLEEDKWDDHYTVAWIDCLARGRGLGRSVLMRGHHASLKELPKKIEQPLKLERRGQLNLPFDLPSRFLNSLTVAAFNDFYYFRQTLKKRPFISDYNSFFYPLDRVGHWNRMYGKRGFVQYQCVLPTHESRRGLQLLLEALTQSRRASFLAVLKRFGHEGPGLLSFPFEGYTLALDLPVSDPELFPFLDRLDEIVLEHGGRVYLAKDTRVRAETFRAMYPRLPDWQRIKSVIDPKGCFSSDLSRMLELGAQG